MSIKSNGLLQKRKTYRKSNQKRAKQHLISNDTLSHQNGQNKMQIPDSIGIELLYWGKKRRKSTLNVASLFIFAFPYGKTCQSFCLIAYVPRTFERYYLYKKPIHLATY